MTGELRVIWLPVALEKKAQGSAIAGVTADATKTPKMSVAKTPSRSE